MSPVVLSSISTPSSSSLIVPIVVIGPKTLESFVDVVAFVPLLLLHQLLLPLLVLSTQASAINVPVRVGHQPALQLSVLP
jgi:hypothetical protein